MATKTFTIGITTAGAYNSATTYKKLARVYDAITNCSYLSRKADNVGHAVTDTEWWQKDIADTRMPVVEQTAQSASINPNTLYRWASSVTALSLTLVTPAGNGTNEYMLEFTVSGNAFTLSCSTTLRWVGGEEPDWTDGMTYQVSILDGLAIAAGWEAARS